MAPFLENPPSANNVHIADSKLEMTKLNGYLGSSTLISGVGEALVAKVEEASPNSPMFSEPYGSKKRMRIAMIGAGISGLNFFKVAEERLTDIDIVCYEKNNDIVAREFQAPHCRCGRG